MKRAPASAGVSALLLTVPVYGLLQWRFSEIAFLNRMAITFGVVIAAMTIIILIKPLAEPKVMPKKRDFDMRPTPLVLWLGGAVIAAVILFYIVFW